MDNETKETQGFAWIWGTQNQEDLFSLMNPMNPDVPRGDQHLSRRYYKVNFMAISKHGTLEFRQHEGTIDPKAICAWADFVLALVRYALDNPDNVVKSLLKDRKPLRELVGSAVYDRMVR